MTHRMLFQRGIALLATLVLAVSVMTVVTSPAGAAAPATRWSQAVSPTFTPGSHFTNGQGSDNFVDVACSSAGNCTAVGTFTNSAGGHEAMAATQTNGVWGAAVPARFSSGAAAASGDQDAAFNAVSCTSAGNCVAVGNFLDADWNQQAMIATETNGTWGVARTVSVGARSGWDVQVLHDVACSSTGNCTAVGVGLDDSGSTVGVYVTESGGTWGSVDSSSLTSVPNYPDYTFTKVSCSSAGNCSALGWYGDSTNNTMTALQSSGHWSDAVPAPSGTVLTDISCTGSGTCTAVGNKVNEYGDPTVAITRQETSGSWGSPVEATIPSDLVGTDRFDLFVSISCVSTGNCTAAGKVASEYGRWVAATATQTNGTWAAMVVVDTDTNFPYVWESGFTSVTCIAVGNCTAVGNVSHDPGGVEAMASTEISGTWQPAAAPTYGDGVPDYYSGTDQDSSFASVACGSDGTCTAVGHVLDNGDVLAVASTSYVPTPPDAPSDAAAVPGDGQATVSWLASASDGGSPVVSYTVTATPSSNTCSTSGATTCTVTGLTNGVSYSFSVVATSEIGDSNASAPSESVVPGTQQFLRESMRHLTATNLGWLAGGTGTGGCLTAGQNTSGNPIPGCGGSPDADGAGVLRLTNSSTNQSGYALFNSPLPTSAGLDVSFTQYQWQSSGSPADGISFFAADGSTNLSAVGPSGGALGYASDGSTAGVVNGLFGVGLDVYGNTNKTHGSGCPGAPGNQVANQIVVMGSGNGTTGYCQVAASGGLGSNALNNSTRVNSAHLVRVVVEPSTASPRHLTVFLDGVQKIQTTVPAAFTAASTFKFGFAASSGGSTDFHEISGLSVASLNSVPPTAPVNVIAAGGSSSANVAWSTPSNDGGSPITGYTVRSTPGSKTCTTSSATRCTVTGLTDGTNYTFSVSATNAIGTSPASAASSPVTSGVAMLLREPFTWSDTTNAGWVRGGTGGSAGCLTASTDAAGTPIPGCGASQLDSAGAGVLRLTNSSTNQSGYALFNSPLPTSAGLDVSFTQYQWQSSGSPADGISFFAADGSTNLSAVGPSGGALGYASDGSTAGVVNGLFGVGLDVYGNTNKTHGSGCPGAPGNQVANQIVVMGSGNGTTGYCQVAASGGLGSNALNNSTRVNSAHLVRVVVEPSTASPRHLTVFLDGVQKIQTTVPAAFTAASTFKFGFAASSGGSTDFHEISGLSVAADGPGAPDAPTNLTAFAPSSNAKTSARVSWVPSFSTGGSAITSYTVVASPGGATCSVTVVDPEVDACTVPGLTFGHTYTFSATATNVAGTSAASSSSSPYVVISQPDAPTAVTTTPGDGQMTISWTPGATNGSDVTSYDVQSWPHEGTCHTTSLTSCTITGLTNGSAYSFTVTATNAAGTSPSSTPTKSAAPGVVPGAPQDVTVELFNGHTLISWNPPSSAGTSPVTLYTVTAAPGGATCSINVAVPESDFCTIDSLPTGISHTFTVKATNLTGAGAASTPSAPFLVATAPGAPTAVSATSSNASASVSFTAPSSDGGSTITGYSVTATDTTSAGRGGQTASGSSSPISVDGLTNGDSYTFTVRAINAIGTGSASDASSAVIPATVPSAPTNVSGTVGRGQSMVSWIPGSANGSAITSYTVTVMGAPSLTCTYTVSAPEADECLITGLADATGYTFEVTATNGIGTSLAGTSSTVTTFGLPSAPRSVTATGGGSSATVTFTAPSSDGGAAITTYTVTATDTTVPSHGGRTASGSTRSIVVAGLTNGDTYTFTVTATNAVGESEASAPSSPITLQGGNAPVLLKLAALPGALKARWAAPGSPLGKLGTYRATAKDPQGAVAGSCAMKSSGRSCIIKGLSGGTAYTVTVVAKEHTGKRNHIVTVLSDVSNELTGTPS